MLCNQHAGEPDVECSRCLAQKLKAVQTLAGHLHEYRETLGEVMKENELLELLLTQTTGLLDAVCSISPAARAFVVSDSRYVGLAQWLKERK